jgi:CRP/FNR family transcriptional regulator, cyclic AMP receptor protein
MIDTKVFKRVHLFTGLPESDLSEIGTIASEELVDAGEIVIEQNSIGSRAYTIAEGSVEVFIRGLGNDPSAIDNERVLVILGKGQVFGEMALIDQGYRSASVRAGREGARLYWFDNKEFNDLCRANTHIGFTVMRNLAIDLAFKLRHRNLAQM